MTRDFVSIVNKVNQDIYLICRPLGGLNDCLNQIEHCRKIAKKTNRKLIVQTETGDKGLSHRFTVPFSQIFNFSDEVNSAQWIELSEKDFFHDRYFPEVYAPVSKSLTVSLAEFTGELVRENKIKSEKYLSYKIEIHESAGGGIESAELLKFVEVKPEIIRALEKVLLTTGRPKVAIHFRSRDWGGASFDSLRNFVSSTFNSSVIYIATDDLAVLTKLRFEFPNISFRSIYEVLDQLKISLVATEIAVLELLFLSFSENLYILPLERFEKDAPKYSGYSRLAKHLWVVNKINQFGFKNWAVEKQPLLGLAGGNSKIQNFLYLLFRALPRVLWKAKFTRGVYFQLELLSKSIL